MRSYAAQDVISLPTLSAAGAVALGQGLLTAAKAQTTLPTLILTRFRTLDLVHKALHQALSQNPKMPTDPQRVRTTDIAEDNAWSALHDWLFGWTKVKLAEAEPARAMYAVLFPTRLNFTKLSYQLEWAEADARLTRIATETFEPEIEKLGGKPILQQVRQAHKAYGDALGITAEGQDLATSGIREPLQAFTKALRSYVLAVAAHADPNDAASDALTDSLLAPLYKWQSNAAASAAAAADPAATTADSPTSHAQAQPPPATAPSPTNGQNQSESAQ